MWVSKFHTHTQQQVILLFCVFECLRFHMGQGKISVAQSVWVLITGIISPPCLVCHMSVHYPVIDRGAQDLARHILITTVPRSNSETDRACCISKDFSCLLKTHAWIGCGPRHHCCTQPADSVLFILATDRLSASYNNNNNNNNNNNRWQ
jgi:hypothetical protein